MQAKAGRRETERLVVAREAAPLRLVVADTSAQDWSREVMRLLKLVDDLDATVLLLIYQRHLTQAQAAAHLGVSQSEIKTRVARGLTELGRLLQPAPM